MRLLAVGRLLTVLAPVVLLRHLKMVVLSHHVHAVVASVALRGHHGAISLFMRAKDYLLLLSVHNEVHMLIPACSLAIGVRYDDAGEVVALGAEGGRRILRVVDGVAVGGETSQRVCLRDLHVLVDHGRQRDLMSNDD